jgi:hypothetical protein
VVIALAASAILLASVVLLIPLGLRVGDQAHDAQMLDVQPLTAPRGVAVTMRNPASAPLIVGLSLRRAGARLRWEGVSYVRIRSGRTSSELLAGNQAWIGILDAGASDRFVIRADAHVGRRAELVAVVGHEGRLRTIHRLVLLGQEIRRDGTARARSRPDEATVNAA